MKPILSTLVFAGSIIVILVGCASAPYEVARLHEKEAELVVELRRAHLAMVDAYVDKKIEVFDEFFFKEYSPKFRKNWEDAFRANTGRTYDPEKDFSLLSNDLVASYESNVEPLNKLRLDLHQRISASYDQVMQAHQAVGAWIHSVEKLNSSQRQAANRLLGSINSSLTLEKVESRIDQVTTDLISRLR